jgi:hypothetical protein
MTPVVVMQSEKNNVTALLLNWKRKENLIEVIKSIREQSVGINIWLWDNNPDGTKYDVDLQIDSPKNFKCWARWCLASMAETEYIFILDDDVKLSNSEVIFTCLKEIERADIIGFTGVKLTSGYFSSKHFDRPSGDEFVDIVKGRFMFMRKSLLNKVPLEYDGETEDIKVSSYAETKLIPSLLRNSFTDLKEGEEALFKQQGQKQKREMACDKYFRNRI